jgi:hypothetical protein
MTTVFDTVEEARLAWGLWCLLRDGIDAYIDKPLPPLPGEYSQRTIKRASGLFGAVKHAVPVEELARRFTPLSGGRGALKGKCPLHAGGKERTPSFVVYTGTQTWQCFGACARGGDVIELARLLMDKGLLK